MVRGLEKIKKGDVYLAPESTYPRKWREVEQNHTLCVQRERGSTHLSIYTKKSLFAHVL